MRQARSRGSRSLGDPQAWTVGAFLAVAAVCAAGAFVGLSASSYWIDELFSLFVVDHHGGFGEVLARALTDTHPPGYYFLLYGWVQAFGVSEAATRALSGILTVASLPLLYLALRPALGRPARAFAVALGAVSHLFALAAQTTRNYALCVLLATILLGLALRLGRRLLAGERAPAGLWIGLWLAGLLGEYVHFYVFLVVGALHLWLLLAARNWRARALVAASGLSLALLMAAYAAALLSHSRQDLHNMWFSNSWTELGRQGWGAVAAAWSGPAFLAVILLALAPWAARLRREAPPSPPRIALALSGLTIAGTVVGGLAVNFLIAPSFGTRSLFVLGPFFWTLGGWMYEAIAPDPATRGGRRLILGLLALLALAALPLRARLAPQTEEWRGSAALAAAEPGCQGQPIPVALPYIFGPSTPFFRRLAEQSFFGWYFPEPQRLHAYTPEEFAAQTADPELRALLVARARGGCPLLAWGVHDIKNEVVQKLQRDIAETSGLPSARVRVRAVTSRRVGMFGDTRARAEAFLFERADGPN